MKKSLTSHLSILPLLATSLLVTPLLVTQKSHANGHLPAGAHNKSQNFTQCAAISIVESNVGRVSRNPEKYTTPIPKGWVVVGVAGASGPPKLVICR